MAKNGLNHRQVFFIGAYIACGNATQAAIEAGYAENTAGGTGHALLKNPKIAAEIERRRRMQLCRIEVSPQNVLFALARVGFADPRRLFDDNGRLKPIKDLDDDMAGAIASVEIFEKRSGGKVVGQLRKIRLSDRVAALEKLGRFLHMDRFTPPPPEPAPGSGPTAQAELDAALQDLEPDQLRALEEACQAMADGLRQRRQPALLEQQDEDEDEEP